MSIASTIQNGNHRIPMLNRGQEKEVRIDFDSAFAEVPSVVSSPTVYPPSVVESWITDVDEGGFTLHIKNIGTNFGLVGATFDWIAAGV